MKIEGVETIDDFAEELNDYWLGEAKIEAARNELLGECSYQITFRQRDIIKEIYEIKLPYILTRKGHSIKPYFLPWDRLLNENEYHVFMAIRCIGAGLYPQYPVGKYSLDFGNPYHKIGLEVDSKTYHTLEKDIERDKELKKMGWKIYHLSSSEAYWNSFQNKQSYDLETYDEDEYLENKTKYLETTLEGILDSICFASLGLHMEKRFYDVANRVAKNHLIIL